MSNARQERFKESEQVSAAEPCDHHWVSKHARGLSITMCSLCGDPKWDDLMRDKYDRDRLWRCLWNAQCLYIQEHDGQVHEGWQIALIQTGPPT